MTIDEAIKHCEEVVEKNEQAKKNGNLLTDTIYEDFCAYHRQLAEWLTELKELKTKYSDVQEKIREIRGYLEYAKEHLNVMGVLEALDIIKDLR